MSWTQDSFDSLLSPVRSSDPITSAEAARIPGRANQRSRVLRALLLYGDMNDERISQVLSIDKGSASKRRGELVDLLLAEPARDASGSLMYTKTTRGGRTMLWRLTMEGRTEAMKP